MPPRDTRTVGDVERERRPSPLSLQEARDEAQRRRALRAAGVGLPRPGAAIPGALLADPKYAARVQAAGIPVGTAPAQALFREATQIVKGLPRAGVAVGSALGKDVADLPGDIVHARPPLDRTGKLLVDQQATYFKEKYGPLLPGGAPASQTLKRVKQEPISTTLDLLAGGSVLGLAGKAGKLSAVRREGMGLRDAYRETKKLPDEELRTLTYGKSQVRPRTSPAFLTRSAEKMYDRFSENLAARGVGGPFSARSRVAKQGAKDLRQESVRSRAALASEANTVKNIGGRPETFGKIRGRAERTRFYWEAQLPESLRGGEGLDLLVADMRRLAAEATDPQAARRLERQARMVEKSKATTYDPQALEAARYLNDEVERIYLEAGKLNPDVTEPRKGLLGRQLGTEDAAGALYVEHTAKAPLKVLQRAGLVRHGGGKTMAPANLRHENQLRLYATGRLRVDPDVIVESWQRAQHYDFVNRSKAFLGGMGEKIGPEGPNKGWFVVNPNGHKLPRRWKDIDPEDAAAAAGFRPDDVLFDDLAEYVENTIAGGADAAALWRKAPDDVVQVHPDAVRHFFNQLVGPQGAGGKLHALGGAADVGNDLLRLSLLYANPGYMPANLIGNTSMALAHQGPFYLGPNIVRSSRALYGRDAKFRDLLLAEVGYGPTVSVAASSKNVVSRATHKFARAESRTLTGDDVIRGAAWMHEARKAGYRTRTAQIRLLTNPKLRNELNQVKSRVEAGMVDFNRAGPVERQLVSRVLFVWPWIRGASVYPVRFAADYPVRTAAAVHAAEVEQARGDDLGLRPNYLQQAFPAGPQKGAFRPIFNMAGTSTPSTPLQTIGAIGSLFSSERPARTVADMLNPGLTAAYDTLAGQIDYGEGVSKTSVPEAFQRNFGQLLPGPNFIRDIASGNRDTKLYRPGVGELLKRRIGRGVIPYDVNVEQMHERGRKALSTVKRAKLDLDETNREISRLLRKGEITATDADVIRKQARGDYEQTVREHKMKKSGRPEEEIARQLVIDQAARDDWPLAQLNDFLKQAGMKEADTEDLAAADREMLKLDVQVAK